jgi:hypothetical protein
MASVTLTMEQDFELVMLLKEEYTSSNMTDSEFANYANSMLQLNINKGHIATRRHAFNIPSNVPPPIIPSSVEEVENTLESRVIALEQKVTAIQHMLDKL